MFENIMSFFKKWNKKEKKNVANSKEAAKERLHLVLMQDRANVSADFLELMKQEIIEVIKKYIDVDESAIDVRLTNKENSDGTNGAPALYANIPILNIKNEARKIEVKQEEEKKEEQEKVKETKQKESQEKQEDKPEKDKEQEEVTETKQEENNNKEENNQEEEQKEEPEEQEQEEVKEAKEEIKSEK